MKRNNLNNRGFTLVELLVVIVILIAIVSLAIPSITSSMERSKEKINKGKMEILGSAAELYLSSELKSKLKDFYEGKCYVDTSTLLSGNYISSDDKKDADNNELGTQVYKKKKEGTNDYTYDVSNSSGVIQCQ